jgi:hypothetical protein
VTEARIGRLRFSQAPNVQREIVETDYNCKPEDSEPAIPSTSIETCISLPITINAPSVKPNPALPLSLSSSIGPDTYSCTVPMNSGGSNSGSNSNSNHSNSNEQMPSNSLPPAPQSLGATSLSASSSTATSPADEEPTFKRPAFVDPLDSAQERQLLNTRMRSGSSFNIYQSSDDIRRLIRQAPDQPMPLLASTSSYQILRTIFSEDRLARSNSEDTDAPSEDSTPSMLSMTQSS